MPTSASSSDEFRFVHAADIHLDSPMLGLEDYDGAPIDVLRGATRQALTNLVDRCIEEEAAFLLICGDVYDGEWKSLATGRFFAAQMARLGAAQPPIPVFLIKGNHDAESLISRQMKVSNVHSFASRKPETWKIEALYVAIHGQSYPDRATRDDLSLNYPAPEPGWFNIGMLHTCATGKDGHGNYAPCEPEKLAANGYHYWALGHIHQREELSKLPYIVFPGNIQGRHVRESDPEGKGCTVVTVRNGEVAELRHVALDTVRWARVEVDLAGTETNDDAEQRIVSSVREAAERADGRLLAARLILRGECPLSLDIHRDLSAFDANVRGVVSGAVENVWVEDIQVRTTCPAIGAERESDSALADLLGFVRETVARGTLDALRDRHAHLLQRVGGIPELAEEFDGDDFTRMTELLPEIEQAILALAGEAA